jgi:hypothetical protein
MRRGSGWVGEGGVAGIGSDPIEGRVTVGRNLSERWKIPSSARTGRESGAGEGRCEGSGWRGIFYFLFHASLSMFGMLVLYQISL